MDSNAILLQGRCDGAAQLIVPPRHQLMHIIRRHNTQIAQYLEISQGSQGIRALEMAQLVQLPLVIPKKANLSEW
ncbi:MAG TPA: hypothetical protein DCZ91_19175 [Lachnospiraceae bacterium]|nr:hypothetical protein [Lachnospiraceae bacterium]